MAVTKRMFTSCQLRVFNFEIIDETVFGQFYLNPVFTEFIETFSLAAPDYRM
jgi:hypothetical protein